MSQTQILLAVCAVLGLFALLYLLVFRRTGGDTQQVGHLRYRFV